MNTIPQTYEKLLKKLIFDTFYTNLKDEINKLNMSEDVFNYINLLSNLDNSLNEIAKNALISAFELLDKSFKQSTERKRKYHIKCHPSRSILTVFGEITFTRTYYVSKVSSKSYCYLDRLLGLHKHDYFDPYIKATIVQHASNHSFQKIANYITDLIGNKIKLSSSFNFVSRQTVRNIILSANVSHPKLEEKETPNALYIMADEKFVHTQNNDNNDVMVKSIVLFDKIIPKNGRNTLNNKMIFASRDKSFKNNLLNYVYNVYNTNHINSIYIMGDGAGWIKKLTDDLRFDSKITFIFALDKYHFKQALWHIHPYHDSSKAMLECILKNKRKDFIRLCNEVIDLYPHRITIIEEKKNYIVNNWEYINNLYKYELSCPMESQISHNLADLFTSRPKGYSIKMIDKLIDLRLLYKNNFNIKKLFLHNFNSKTILTVGEEEINYSHFEMFEKKETYSIPSTAARINMALKN